MAPDHTTETPFTGRSIERLEVSAAVEPSVSNMSYITTVPSAAERARAGPKNGAEDEEGPGA